MLATWRLRNFIRPYWRWALLAPLLMALEVSMDLLLPRLIQVIVDEGISQGDMRLVLTTGVWMVAVAVIGLLGGIGCGIYAIRTGQAFGADLRQALFAKVQTLSFANLDKLETGGLITRLTNDVTQVTELVMMMLRIMVRAPLLMVGGLVMAILTSPRLAWLFIVLIPIVLITLWWVMNRAYPLFSGVQKRLDTLNAVLQENLAGVRVVKAFVRSNHEIARFGRANTDLMEQNISAVRTVAVTMPLMMLTVNVGIVGALWFGGALVDTGTMHVGQIIAFINYLMMSLTSLLTVGMLVMRISRAEASAVRIEEVLHSEAAVQDRAQKVADFVPQGRVAFEQVDFAYNDESHDLVLDNVSFVAEPGQTVALLGATGSGKSSLISLIPRFYDVTGGRVTIDGVDVRDLDQVALRRHIGVALQESVLFSGSIRDNIRYGRPDADDEVVIAAAKMAQAHDFISGFAEGYDSMVGQRGVNLSGGQKQRIAIARALLPDPAILILDDSTSAVDVETEARIQEALARARQGRTSFVVAQRISTVLTADKILVLDEGRVVAEGTHAQLMRSSPLYREIYASQLDAVQDEVDEIAWHEDQVQVAGRGANHVTI
ncbi:MAG: ABC transporter ATP-binding protein [Caldilineaceae bacterium]|nr:ABC transporter ATP-binding protein [Caldilineaceae bacterium]